MLKYSPKHKLYYWAGSFDTRHLPKTAGFVWHEKAKAWITPSPYIAYLLFEHADRGSCMELLNVDDAVKSSMSKGYGISIPVKDGLEYLPFQCSGIDHIHKQFILGRDSVLLADEQGLGKTIQAVGAANIMGFKKLLVICPATLRLNWAREIEAWHLHNPGIKVIMKGSDIPKAHQTVITSYDLAKEIKDVVRPDLIIVDESHYIKNSVTIRTKLILGDFRKNWRGLIDRAPTIFLTGTPEPNGNPAEIYNILKRCAPHVIDNMKYMDFVKKFCNWFDTEEDVVMKGAKNHEEFYTRLRGSGFMIRRLKKDVLKDLPPKRYQMIVFPASGETRKVLKKEQPFNAEEILKEGMPVGSALPEIRKEMGIAKLPESISFIKDLLDGGVEKIGLFAHHVDVVKRLAEALDHYGVVMIIGATSQKMRQVNVDAFQNEPAVRVFIGNEAAEEGITLTAASDVVDVEPEWVPGKMNQRHDRFHRITQTKGVMIYSLVVEGSLDAHIMGTAAKKQLDIKRTLDGN